MAGWYYDWRYETYVQGHKKDARIVHSFMPFDFSPEYPSNPTVTAGKPMIGRLTFVTVREGFYLGGTLTKIRLSIGYAEEGAFTRFVESTVPNIHPQSWGDIDLSTLDKRIGTLHVLRVTKKELEYAYTPPK